MSYRNNKFARPTDRRRQFGSGQKRRPTSRARRGSYIDPRRFVATASSSGENTNAYIAKNKFTDFNINKLLHENLAKKGYVTPSAIQDQAIQPGLEGRDVIGLAGTGTGKTAAFALPVLNRVMASNSKAIVIAPTRELAQQILDECKELARNSGLRGALLIGGSSMSLQLKDLGRRPNIVIGTPGRIIDHLNRGSLDLSKFDIVVLDEVDRMLDMGFVNDVQQILNQTSDSRQSFFFSATMDEKVRKLIEDFANNPVTIDIQAGSPSDNVHQDVIYYRDKNDKLSHLHDLLIDGKVSKAIVFDETQRSVERLSNELVLRGFMADAIHGGKSQGQRQRALAKFKKNEVNILVATDVAARGIDVVDVSHVINYSVPKEYSDYIHRIGRAGRAGKTGHALTFVEDLSK